MHVVIVEKDEQGKIYLTQDQLQKMLDEAYEKGYQEGKAAGILQTPTITPTNVPYNPWTVTYGAGPDRDTVTINKTWGTINETTT